MGKQKETGISWCDFTFNPWIGCQKVSPACKHCYAESQVNRFGGDFAGTRKLTGDAYWREPLKWSRDAEGAKERPRVFCASLADVFEDWDGWISDSKGNVFLKRSTNGEWFSCEEEDANDKYHADPIVTMNDVRQRLFALIDATPNLDWLLLTKRPENIRNMWRSVDVLSQEQADDLNERGELFRRNVWLGTTVENQEQANKRIPELLKCRDLSPVLFLSCEPLLSELSLGGLIDLESEFCPVCRDISCDHGTIDWVIAGGESGRDARPMNPDWARSLRDQCQAAGVAYHFKQWGEWTYLPYRDNARLPLFKKADFHAFDEETVVYKVGKKAAGRMLDGREWNEVPK